MGVKTMSFYYSMRVKGTIKKELREIFEPIALEGKWKESPDPVLRGFGEEEEVTRYIPLFDPFGPKRWDDHPWPRSYNKETGEWIFETSVNGHGCYFPFWEEEILPYCFEKIEHYEFYMEDNPPYDHTSLSKYEDGCLILLGNLDGEGNFIPWTGKSFIERLVK